MDSFEEVCIYKKEHKQNTMFVILQRQNEVVIFFWYYIKFATFSIYIVL